jgi:hypothetical protein
MIPVGISGSPWVSVDEGLSVVPATSKEGLDFITNKKSLHDYIVSIIDGYAEFIFKDSNLLFKRKQPVGNIVQDLNYRVVFFNYLNIQHKIIDNTITFTFKLDDVNDVYRSKFLTLVTPTNGLCNFYITEYNNPNALIDTIEIDLYQLYQQTTWSRDCDNNGPVSVWALRK